MIFKGSFDALKGKLPALSGKGEWLDVEENKKQFCHHNGAILNWYPSTGTINFQGNAKGAKELEKFVSEALRENDAKKPYPSKACVSVLQDVSENKQIAQSINATPSSSLQDLSSARSISSSDDFNRTEIVIGLVGAVGIDLKKISNILIERLKVAQYTAQELRISKDIIPLITSPSLSPAADEYTRISTLMTAGDDARKITKENAILAFGAASWISQRRKTTASETQPLFKHAFIVNSLKHPEEVRLLREIYPQGFYLLGVHADDERRETYLVDEKRMSKGQAAELMARDQDERLDNGQRLTDTFYLSDFFIRTCGSEDQLKHSLWRILDILFGNPYITPAFDEYAMFLAFSSSLRSADLSRQVGAVVARNDEILATGANDCPKFGGGLYWPQYDDETNIVKNDPAGRRDYERGEDSNKAELTKIIDEIAEDAFTKGISEKDKLRDALKTSRIRTLTEFGRSVHAEMEALLACARNNISTKDATLYCTTFPCHNCARHIIAAGIKRVVYIEPYSKSKALEFHNDAIRAGFPNKDNEEEFKNKVIFEPFVGIGPQKFFDLFSLRLGSGYEMERKDKEGKVLNWQLEQAHLRVKMLASSYLDLESVAYAKFNHFLNNGDNKNG